MNDDEKYENAYQKEKQVQFKNNLRNRATNPSQWNFLNNHMNNIVRRKTMLDYIVKLNSDLKNQKVTKQMEIKDETDDDLEEEDFSLNNFLSGELQPSYTDKQLPKSRSIYEIQNNFSEQYNEGDIMEPIRKHENANSRFIKSRIVKEIARQNNQNNQENDRIRTLNNPENEIIIMDQNQDSLQYPPVNYESESQGFYDGYGNQVSQELQGSYESPYVHQLTGEAIEYSDIIDNQEFQEGKVQNSKALIEEKGCEMLETICAIRDKAKNDIIHKLLDGEWHHKKELLRLAKKSRYIGDVSFGMMMLSFKDIISDEFMQKKVISEGESYYKINDNFMGLARAACMNYRKNLF